MSSESSSPESKYRDFSEAIRNGVDKTRKLQQARYAVQSAIEELSSQVAEKSGGYLVASKNVQMKGEDPQVAKYLAKLDKRSVLRCGIPDHMSVECIELETTGTPVRKCWICDTEFGGEGFPMFVKWDTGTLYCEKASDIYQAIWTALSDPRVGDFILRTVPHLYPEEPESPQEYDRIDPTHEPDTDER